MIKKYIFIFALSFIFSQDTGGSLSFMNISPTSNAHSLGNTIASEMNNPASLLLNPANAWNSSRIKASTSYWMQSNIPGVSYSNQFGSFSIKKWTFSAGHVGYGVKDIEFYDEQAVQGNNFSFGADAFMFGVAHKITNLMWGIGVNGAVEKFSDHQSNGHAHFGVDLGVTIADLRLDKNMFVTGGMCFKNTILGLDQIRSSYATSSGFGKFSYVFNDIAIFNIYGDLIAQQALGRYHLNFGTQILISPSNSPVEISLNGGISDWHILGNKGEGQYQRKFACGFGLKVIEKIEVQFSTNIFNPIYYSNSYLTLKFKI